MILPSFCGLFTQFLLFVYLVFVGFDPVFVGFSLGFCWFFMGFLVFDKLVNGGGAFFQIVGYFDLFIFRWNNYSHT